MSDFVVLFKTIFLAMVEIFLLASLGFMLVRKRFIDEKGLGFLSSFLIIVILPLFIFTKTVKTFSFTLYPNWWIFPLISLAVNAIGFGVGFVWFGLFSGKKTSTEKRQLISLVGFQNSGYIPLILAASILSGLEADKMFIYIFLFLLGFNLIIWSFGAWFLTEKGIKKFELGTVFSPPVLAIMLSLVLVVLGIDRFLPGFIFRPAKLLGDCLLPMSMIVVGGNLALVSLKRVDKIAITNVTLLKLIALPIIALAILWYLKPDYLIGFLVILEAAVPSATSLSLISRHYSTEDNYISHGIFFTHLFCIISIPIFLIIYQMFAFFK